VFEFPTGSWLPEVLSDATRHVSTILRADVFLQGWLADCFMAVKLPRGVVEVKFTGKASPLCLIRFAPSTKYSHLQDSVSCCDVLEQCVLLGKVLFWKVEFIWRRIVWWLSISLSTKTWRQHNHTSGHYSLSCILFKTRRFGDWILVSVFRWVR
jgi:hypothetical protein